MKTEIIINGDSYKKIIKELPNLCCIKIKRTCLYYLVSKCEPKGDKVVLISLNNGNYYEGTCIVDLYNVRNVLGFIEDGSWEIIESKITI